MGTAGHYTRRAFVASSALLVVAGCGGVLFPGSRNSAASDPPAAIRAYFALVSSGRYDEARTLLSASYQARLGSNGLQPFLHSIKAAQITDVVDAVAWANGLGARLPVPPADKREYIVTLTIDLTSPKTSTWSSGQNRRFIDLNRQGGTWQIDSIDLAPGALVTGKSAASAPADPQVTMLPLQALRLGPVQVDRFIYSARQHAADLGELPWAINPLDVVHRDGPSFGITASDRATLVGQGVDPGTLVPRADVVVQHDNQLILVTVEQPIRIGPGGVWAIASVRIAPPFPS